MAEAAGAAAGEPFLLVGRIRKPHGVRGELFVWVETDQPGAVFRSGRSLQLGGDAGPEPGLELTVERARPFKDGVLLKTVEHASRSDALEALRGRSLYIARSEAVPLEQDEVYYHELIGLRVVAEGREIGRVREVFELPEMDMLAVERDGGDDLLVPFARSLIHRLDTAARVLEIEPPPGLLEL